MKKFKSIRIAAAAISAVFVFQLTPFAVLAEGNEVSHEAVLNQLAEDASGTDAESKAIVGEEVGMRAENEKHYRLEDGSYVAAQYSTPVHYMDEDGNWEDIDNTLVYEAGESDGDFNGYINKNNSFSVKLAENSEEQLFLFEDGENAISMKLAEDDAQSAEIAVENSEDGAAELSELSVKEQNEETMSLDALTAKAEYTDVMPGVDLEYTVMPDGVKEYIVVNEELADYEFSFELALGDMIPRANNDGSISIITSAGEEKYVIPAPYMTDANDRYSDAVTYTITAIGDGVYALTVAADINWIEDEETVFPVKIDPTVMKHNPDAGSVEGAFISSAFENTFFSKSPSWYVGNGASFGNVRTLIKCTVTNMLHGSNVLTSAKLKLYQKNFTRTANPTIEVHSVTSSWDYNEARWNDEVTFDDGALDAVTITGNTNGTCIEFDITRAVAENLGNTAGDYGIILKASDETLADSTVCFASSDSNVSSELRPQFEVYYRQQKGLEDDYSYVRIDCGESGTAYINTYNGDLNFVNRTFAAFENAVEINHTYGTHLLNREEAYENYTNAAEEITYGNGWMISAVETIYPITEQEYTGNTNASKTPGYAYVYSNENAVNIYLEQSSSKENVYIDRDGRNYTMTVSKNADNTVNAYTLIAPDGITRYFKTVNVTSSDGVTRQKGYIDMRTALDGKPLEYTYKNRAPSCLTEIAYGDDAFDTVEFESSKFNGKGVLTSISSGEDNRVTVRYSGNVSLQSIAHSTGRTTVFQYDSYSRLASVDNNGEYKLIFGYDTNGRIESVRYKSPESTAFKKAEFTYEAGATTVCYSNNGDIDEDINLKYFFDINGNNIAVSVTDKQGRPGDIINHSGIKGLNNTAINEQGINYTAFAKEDVIGKIQTLRPGIVKFTGDENVQPHSGDFCYRIAAPNSLNFYRYTNDKSVLLAPGTHTVSAYIKTTEAIDGTIQLVAESRTSDVVGESDAISQTVNNDWQKVTATFNVPGDYYKIIHVNVVINCDAGPYVYVDDLNVDGRPLAWNLRENAVIGMGFESYGSTGLLGTNTYPTYVSYTDEPENVLFDEQSLKIEGDLTTEKSVYYTTYSNIPTCPLRLSGWGKASSLPLNDDGSNGFELFAYYVYYLITKNDDGTVASKELKTVSTAIPFNWQNDDWQFVSEVINAPDDVLAENQEIRLYSVTVGALYKNNIGNAYFDNIELTPVE